MSLSLQFSIIPTCLLPRDIFTHRSAFPGRLNLEGCLLRSFGVKLLKKNGYLQAIHSDDSQNTMGAENTSHISSLEMEGSNFSFQRLVHLCMKWKHQATALWVAALIAISLASMGTQFKNLLNRMRDASNLSLPRATVCLNTIVSQREASQGHFQIAMPSHLKNNAETEEMVIGFEKDTLRSIALPLYFSTEDYNSAWDSDTERQTSALRNDSDALAAEVITEDAEPLGRPLTVPLKIVGLRGSIPARWIREFTEAQGKNARLKIELRPNPGAIAQDIVGALTSRKINPQSALAADLVTVSDAWLPHVIAARGLCPLKGADKSDWFQRLSPAWQSFLRRNSHGEVSEDGDVYVAPYRWGSLVMAVRSDLLRKHNIGPITSWKDLWRPEFRKKLGLVQSEREIIGITLKSLGASMNAQNFDAEVEGGKEAVATQFDALQQQVRLYDSLNYLKALNAGDIWIAIGWSSDVVPFAKRSSHVTVVVPKEGTFIWADFWGVPAMCSINTEKFGGRIRGPSPLVSQWIDFCLQPARQASFQPEVCVGASPLDLVHVPLLDKRKKWSNGTFHEFLEPLSNDGRNSFSWLLSKREK